MRRVVGSLTLRLRLRHHGIFQKYIHIKCKQLIYFTNNIPILNPPIFHWKMVFFSKHHFQTKNKTISFLGKFAFFPVKNHYIHHEPPFLSETGRASPVPKAIFTWSRRVAFFFTGFPSWSRSTAESDAWPGGQSNRSAGRAAGAGEKTIKAVVGEQKIGRNTKESWFFLPTPTMLCVFFGGKSFKIIPNV